MVLFVFYYMHGNMEMQQDRYSFDWNTFQTHLQETQVELYNEKHFTDVTLVSDDMIQVRAHKTILSSASSVFKQLLMMHESTTNQILFLKGINHEELETLLQFIYLGEAKVYESRVELFVSALNDLGIKELNLKTEKRFEEKSDNTENIFDEDHSIEVFHKKVEESKTIKKTANNRSKDLTLHQKNTPIQCSECNASFLTIGNLNKHYKSMHGGKKYPCRECGKTFTQKVTMTRHVESVHLGIRYPCKTCQKSFTQSDNLVFHMKQEHQFVLDVKG